jgi:hypothetical protein
MTEMRQTTGEYTHERSMGREPTGWVGWILFAGIMLFMVGAFQATAGLVALFNSDYYAVTSSHLVVHANYTAWGWTHLALGVLAIFAGWGVVVGQLWARVVAIAIAFLSALANIAFVDAAPVWSIVMITLDVLVIYAVSVHGREMKALD